jgi:inosine-uridine nucleoside N-ribohydrolase
METQTLPVWLDTDIGNDIDDAVALAYLLRHPRCRLVGVSTVTGAVEDRSRMAAAVTFAAGRGDVPIFSGYSDPLSGPGQPNVPQAATLTAEERARSYPAVPDAALQALVAAARAKPGELTLLSIGPMTNVARFFDAAPELPKLLKELVLMAGHFWPPKPGAEWNVLCDPEAGRRVAAAPVRRRWYGLDVTLQCAMPATEVHRKFTGPLLGTVRRFAEVWFQKHDRITFHDPLAAACVFEPELCTYEPGRVEVELDGNIPGRTVPLAALPGARKDQLARTVDAARFFDHYFATVC